MVNSLPLMLKAAMSDRYIPVSCQLHSEYELAIMHAQTLQLIWRTATGKLATETLKPYDLITREGSEFLLVQSANGEDKKIRLDKIIEAHPVS